MSIHVLANEAFVRFSVFAGVLAIMAIWEVASPRRPSPFARTRRWPANLAIVAIDALLVRLLFPIGAVGLALLCEQQGWGLLNIWRIPAWAAVPIGVVVLDLVIYLQHVIFHAVPALWRLHRMHHSDLHFDVTTGSRFHPIEILLSLVVKIAIVSALGAPPVSVFVFELLLNATAMFNHSNVAIPPAIDRMLRWLVVTPDMHRVHHSVVVGETNSNFGFNLPWWDRLLGTYGDQPAAGHERMIIGTEQFRDPHELRLDRLLTQPFRAGGDRYSIIDRD